MLHKELVMIFLKKEHHGSEEVAQQLRILTVFPGT